MATGQAPSNPVPAMRTYPPAEHPVVVIGPQYLAQYPVELAVSTKLWTLGENDFKVSDINGTVIFQVTKKLFSLTDRRFLKDAASNTIVNLKRKIMSLHQTWETELDVFLAHHNEGELPDFKVKGEYGESACSVLLGDSNTMLAQMHKRHSLASTILNPDSLGVNVYPNVDYAFIVTLVVILGQINADQNGKH
ncbi:hypothetical protein OIU84_015315 [Salix udensis]|uniref:Protein LURP-one-related 15-like n=1 Tax=Salix udensis TaxID=889485 RepID=A0AAD6JE44_9ROSI|nr:hypothetical protein OIU84_015315 [Salix udensis]